MQWIGGSVDRWIGVVVDQQMIGEVGSSRGTIGDVVIGGLVG